ncbi:hypothetical protein PMNALOAF_3542 [Methylobacterium adhaesivum]|uniref:site-specific DNA-methyltransferase (adenine-specific) n=1 Tax=Methylobacterium adhaesivum TaxID=333297 RepID=A0ABT8BLK4_9HYPH|nr:DNA methyltransferase [Methylobacterium adhaesivum]MDN3592400.1 DNA methyltransferase [Methylobacterium adhaesivum]GJD32274.1 hypothetical protein PMNALOAF_3542 [Methylobacterium adhaesivum]
MTIKARRERLGLSQADVSEALGVTKSLLSMLENGKRVPTEDQVDRLAEILRLPRDLVVIGSGRLPGDVRSALVTDAPAMVAAVRERIEARAVTYPTEPAPGLAASTSKPPRPGAPIPERVDVARATTSYRTHSYHTKVPPEAIVPFIRAFTRTGDLVCDPFCGSGMTGVAAIGEGRNALLSDLSPAAVHIARNYTTFCEPEALVVALAKVEALVRPTIDWLYRPAQGGSLVEYTTWSDVYACPRCSARMVYWDIFHKGGVDNDGLACPKCRTVSRKADLGWVCEEPVQSHTSSVGARIDTHAPTAAERALIADADQAPIPYWIPDVDFDAGREMWRAGHRVMGIASAKDFYTRRNLHALGALRHAIVSETDGRVREALMFAFTAAVNRASRRYQWNAKRPTNVMTGTLYVSSLRYEWNVWSLFRRKAADVLRYYRTFPTTGATAQVFQRSATDLGGVPDGAADMVFMDPPFGANIFYADASLLWDAWLGKLTDQAAEIVVNKHRTSANGGKTLADYGELMGQAFGQAARILKPGGRGVLAFSNSDDAVWEAVRGALSDAGFETERVHMLYKGQPSIKGVKGVTGKENVTTFDLMLCLKHRTAVAVSGAAKASPEFVDAAIREALGAGGRTDAIYSAVVRAALAAGLKVTGLTMPAVARRCRELGAAEVDGLWSLPGTPDAPPRPFLEGYLATAADVPVSVDPDPATARAMPGTRVAGGRNSAFYMAHSYHTKVPPEAVIPFIEHYTKPGDVVLDPFCGSGMTGVAAAMSGRRAILNDLSPAAVHLAWNHTRGCDPEALERGFAEVDAAVGERIGKLYATRDDEGRPALAHWTLWSSRHRCPSCHGTFQLWDAMDRKTGRLGTVIACPSCKADIKRSGLKSLGSAPAWVAYETATGKRGEKAASPADRARATKLSREDIREWFPDVPVGADREMYIRCALALQDISEVADFYTPRNLQALALIWKAIMDVGDDRVRRALAFAFTNTAWHGTRMRRYNARGGQRPLTGTLYVPQLSSEANVLEVMRNKIEQLKRYYRAFQPLAVPDPAILLGGAGALSQVADASVDYVFTDPPFGSNIFYADCNLIWEAWLGRVTDATQEAVVNKSLRKEKGGKGLSDYAALIEVAMAEMARVLKPGGWATVVFHNTDKDVWQAIRDAAGKAGFSFHEAASLDRRQQSHKGYKGRSGAEDVAHFDVVFSLRKPAAGATRQRVVPIRTRADLKALVAKAASDPGIRKHGVQGVHAEVMRLIASEGGTDFVDFAEVRAAFEALPKVRGKLASAG